MTGVGTFQGKWNHATLLLGIKALGNVSVKLNTRAAKREEVRFRRFPCNRVSLL